MKVIDCICECVPPPAEPSSLVGCLGLILLAFCCCGPIGWLLEERHKNERPGHVSKPPDDELVPPRTVREPPETTPVPSLLSAEQKAALAKVWRGSWASPEGFLFDADIHLRLDPSGAMEGRIEWTVKKAPESNRRYVGKIGQTGTEHVRGVFDPKTRMLTMEGYGTDDPQSIIGLDKYRLTLSEDLARLHGVTWNYGTWDATFSLTPKIIGEGNPQRPPNGILVLKTKVAILKGVDAWVEVDGKRVADWNVGTREVQVTIPAGNHRVAVYSIYRKVRRIIFVRDMVVAPDTTVPVDVGP